MVLLPHWTCVIDPLGSRRRADTRRSLCFLRDKTRMCPQSILEHSYEVPFCPRPPLYDNTNHRPIFCHCPCCRHCRCRVSGWVWRLLHTVSTPSKLTSQFTYFPTPSNNLQHLNFEKSYSLQFPLLSDIGANVADLYGSKLDIPFMGKFANRLTFIIGSDGKIEKVKPTLRQFL